MRVTLQILRKAYNEREAAWKKRLRKHSRQAMADLAAERRIADLRFRDLAEIYVLQRLKTKIEKAGEKAAEGGEAG